MTEGGGGATGAIETTGPTVTKFMPKPRLWEPPIKLHVSPDPAALGVDEEALVMASHEHIHKHRQHKPKKKGREGGRMTRPACNGCSIIIRFCFTSEYDDPHLTLTQAEEEWKEAEELVTSTVFPRHAVVRLDLIFSVTDSEIISHIPSSYMKKPRVFLISPTRVVDRLEPHSRSKVTQHCLSFDPEACLPAVSYVVEMRDICTTLRDRCGLWLERTT